jgi:hypothetical protein
MLSKRQREKERRDIGRKEREERRKEGKKEGRKGRRETQTKKERKKKKKLRKNSHYSCPLDLVNPNKIIPATSSPFFFPSLGVFIVDTQYPLYCCILGDFGS